MSKRFSVYKRRVLIKFDRKRIIKRLVNIQVIYKDNKFFEYKITFDGFSSASHKFIKGGVIDSVKGILKQGKENRLRGFLEIGYHRNGNTFYKDIGGLGNFSKIVYPSIDDIKKPMLFLRIIGLNFKNILSIANLVPSDKPIILKNFSTDSFMACDFYLSKRFSPKGKRYVIRPPKKRNKYKNFQTFQFEDKNNEVDLHLVFYSSNVREIYVMLPPRNFYSRVKSYYWHIYSSLCK